MPWIRGFIWDEENVAHISRHQVSPEEVEEVLTGDPVVLRGPDGRYLAYGRTANGRQLFAVYVSRPGGRIRVLTAREMTDKEKRFYRKRRK
jgi:uncharacterized DUF497 family protein